MTGETRSRPRRSLRLPAWVGVLPFLAFAAVALILPIGFLVWESVRRTTTTGSPVLNPTTLQYSTPSHTSFTFSNFAATLHQPHLHALETSLKLSAITAVLAAVLGFVLAQAVVASKGGALKRIVTTASAVTANFGGIPLAFIFIATIDANAGVFSKFVQNHLGFSLQDDLGFNLQGLSGISVVYMYFLVPLMVLVTMPALEGIKEQWGEAAQNLGATRMQYWRWVAAPVLLPSFLGAMLLVFCASLSAYATAYAINSFFPLVTIDIVSLISGNVLAGPNLGAALAVDMILIVLPLTGVYLWLQRRTSRWLA